MATQYPYFQFYAADWLSDPALRSVSFAARGLWIDLICMMDRSPRRGVLVDSSGGKLPPKVIARCIGANPLALGKLIAELDLAGVLSIGEGGEIFSRRMVRDEQIRQQNSKNGALGGNPAVKRVSEKPVKADIEKNREEKKRIETPTESCPAALEPKALDPRAAAEVVMTFQTTGKVKAWNLTREKLLEWEETYPNLDVEALCRKILQWTRDNPSKIKTARGMPAFIGRWIAKDADRPGSGSARRGKDDGEGGGETLAEYQSKLPQWFVNYFPSVREWLDINGDDPTDVNLWRCGKHLFTEYPENYPDPGAPPADYVCPEGCAI